ncbi:hypothetical protein [Paenibacillus gansuensis]|uniref:DUF4305 domain-containing protein n=1 Tax=Paenibacillus gansuensis TaxID=306542 RepID=A0ABW5P908_9BACL
MVNWIKQVNLLWLFVLLFAFHGILYYALGTESWFTVTLMATAVDTAVVALVQFLLPGRGRQNQ